MSPYNTLTLTVTRPGGAGACVLLLAVNLLLGPGAEKVQAAKATVGGTTGGVGRPSHPSAGRQSELEILKRRYYLAPDDERFPVLDRIRELGTAEALDFTMELLRYPDIKVRREAVDALKRWGTQGLQAVFAGLDDPEIGWLCESIFVEMGPRVTAFLLDNLDSDDPGERSRAAYLMGTIRDPITVGPLYKHLKDPDRSVRIQVIQALCDLGDPRSLEGMLDLFEVEDVGLVDFVLRAAERFGPRAAAPLRAALARGSAKVRSGAALALGRLRLPDTLPDLFEALSDPSAPVRRSVVKALDSFHDMSAAPGLFSALSDPDLEVQDYATSALARLAPDIYPRLMDRVGDSDPGVRKNVITALRKIGDRRAVPVIISALDDPDVNVRMFAVTALVEMKDPRSISGLIARMRGEDEMAWLVSYAFMEIGEAAVEELLKATGDDSFCLTRNLVILQMGDRAIETLHSRATGEGDTTVRFNAIAILGELGKPESVPVLAGLLPSDEVGWVAANALARMGRPGWESLATAASGTGTACENACGAITGMEDPRLYLELVQALGSDSARLRRAVSEPLTRAGGDVVPLVTEKMAELEGNRFDDAAEILCRIQDAGAVRPLGRVLFPEPWEPAALDAARLYDLRKAYIRKGSIPSLQARLREDMGGAGGGGGPWERVAP